MTDLLLEKDVERYLRQVGRALVGPRATRTQVVESLRGDVWDYLEAHPGADLEELEAHFGAPRKIADEMLAALPPSTLRSYVRRHFWARTLLILLAVVILGTGLTLAIERICYAANGNPFVIIEQPEEIDSIPENAIMNH